MWAGRCRGLFFQPLADALAIGQRLEDVLCVGADAHLIAPLLGAGERRQGAGDGFEKRRFALAVVAHHRDVAAAIEIEGNAVGDDHRLAARRCWWIADGHFLHQQSGARTRLRIRQTHFQHCFALIEFNFFQFFKLLATRLGLRRLAGGGLVAGDPVFELGAFFAHFGVELFGLLAAGFLIGEVFGDASGIDRHLTTRDFQRVGAGTHEEFAIMRDNQVPTGERQQELLEQQQCLQIEVVGRLVEDQKIGLGQQHRREADTGLETT